MAIILGANMLYINFCLFKETPMAPKGLKKKHEKQFVAIE